MKIFTYRSRNKIYGNPFLQRDFPSIRAQMQSNVNHKFFCICTKKEEIYVSWNAFLSLHLRNLRVCDKITAIDSFDQCFCYFDNLLPLQSHCVVDFLSIIIIIRRRIGRFLDFLIRSICFDLGDDTFACPKCLFDNKSFMKIGSTHLSGLN